MLNITSFSQLFHPLQNSGPCNSVNYLGHSKTSVDDDDDDETPKERITVYRTQRKWRVSTPIWTC